MLRLSRAEHADRLVRALRSTTDRYLHGCLSKATWRSHVTSLWGTAEAYGVADQIAAVLEDDECNRFRALRLPVRRYNA